MDTITLQGGIFISLVLYTIGFIVMLFTVLISTEKEKGISMFVLYFLFMALGMAGIYYREFLTPFFSVVVANTFLMIGSMVLLMGVSVFFKTKEHHIPVLIMLILYITAFIVFTYTYPNVTYRIVVYSFSSLIVFSRLLYILIMNKEEKIHKIDLFGFIVLLYLLVHTLRIFQVLISSTYVSFFDYAEDAVFVMLLAIIGTLTIPGMLSILNNRYIKELQAGEDTLHNFISGLPTPVFVHDKAGNIINVSKTFTESSGYTLEDVPTVDIWTEKAYGENKKEIREIIKRLYTFRDVKIDNQVTIITKSGDTRIWSFHSGYIGTISNDRDIAVSVALDVTESTEMSYNLRNSEARLILAQEISQVGDWELDLINNTVWASKQAYKIYELEDNGKPLDLSFLHQLVDEEDLFKLNSALQKLINNGKGYSVSFKLNGLNGKSKYITSKAILENDADGNPVKVIGVIQDITVQKENEKQLQFAAYNDFLTGLPNRRFYEESLEKFTSNEYFPLTIVMADINGLKLINDAFGHDSGDELLKNAANIIADSIGENDIAARIGGDEFVMILPNTDNERAEDIIRNINVKADSTYVQSIKLSISFGSKTMDDNSGDIYELYRSAEDRMYREKLLEIPSMRSGAIETILSTLYEKDSKSEEHSRSVSSISEKIAESFGMSREQIGEVKTAGLLHDIGKIIIPSTIINKKGKLSKKEYKDMKNHTEIGFRILNSTQDMRGISKFVLNHHERWDGTGYPRQIKGADIPLQSRIITIADAFDAMTSERTYRVVISKKEALQEIIDNSGTQFDPELVECFKNHFEIITKD